MDNPHCTTQPQEQSNLVKRCCRQCLARSSPFHSFHRDKYSKEWTGMRRCRDCRNMINRATYRGRFVSYAPNLKLWDIRFVLCVDVDKAYVWQFPLSDEVKQVIRLTQQLQIMQVVLCLLDGQSEILTKRRSLLLDLGLKPRTIGLKRDCVLKNGGKITRGMIVNDTRPILKNSGRKVDNGGR